MDCGRGKEQLNSVMPAFTDLLHADNIDEAENNQTLETLVLAAPYGTMTSVVDRSPVLMRR